MREDGELPMRSRSIHMPCAVGLASEFICYPDESDGLGNNLNQRTAVTVA